MGAIVALPWCCRHGDWFYLLVTMGPNGPLGQLTQTLGLGTLPFTFPGLVIWLTGVLIAVCRCSLAARILRP